MERGLIRVQAEDGSYPYEQFELETTEQVFLALTELLDGDAVPIDLSASNLKVYLRAKPVGTTAVPINVEMTKRTGTSLPGDTGLVKAPVSPRYASFDAEQFCRMGAYIVNTAIADTPTLSGFQETLWAGMWEWQVLASIEEEFSA